MDSGNSGSLQSSSGGDEEYDSRAAASISAFLNNPTAPVGPISQPSELPPLPPLQNITRPAMFDSLTNYSQLQNPSSLFNPNMIWSKTLRSDPNSTDTVNPTLSSSPFIDSLGTLQSSIVSASTEPAAISGPSDNHNQAVRNPKKRSRASRRAPTTVLTTDTTNFRAMVQEFTGIPELPFTSSPFQRSRIEFFGTHTSVIRSTSLDTAQPPYLRQPFLQHMQPSPAPRPPPFHSSASSSFLSPPQSSNLFATLLQSTMKFPPVNSASMIGSKAHDSLEIPSNDSYTKLGGLDEFAASPRNDDQVEVRGNYYNFSMNCMNGKVNNYLANSSPSFHSEKALDSVAATRGEGMVESWLCSSSD
ncbi:uncharacterized protein LOC111390078 [Olea europaea var. sylvestris]|uniref:uncharacterized protein LOC111390078 n=1 Tax=Olea europaea var. sylvestris TaxID=158386 RepID=UPI000C1D394B|nr:uncharacterized protein LOC111390078 [Olea europaea var. sylvestris]